MNDEQEPNALNFYLNQARKRAEQDEFKEALEAVREGYKFARRDETLLLDQLGQEIKNRRRERVKALTEELGTLISTSPQNLTPSDLDKGEQVLFILEKIGQPGEVEDPRQRWRVHRRRAEAQQVLAHTRERLSELWKFPLAHLYRYEEALGLARQRVREYPDEPAFQDLLVSAEERRNEAKRKATDLGTAAIMGKFKILMDELERLYEAGEEELPWYEWSIEEIDGQPVRLPMPSRPAPAEEAIRHLLDLARVYQDGKAEEYRGWAQAALPADPEGAADWMRQALGTFDYLSPDKRAELETFRDEQITPALDKRTKARGLLADAEKPGQDVEVAWGLVAAAAECDPYLPELEQVRERLRPRLTIHWGQLLDRADEDRREGRIEDGQAKATRVVEKARGDPELQAVCARAEDVFKRCQADLDSLGSVKQQAQKIAELVEQDPSAADVALTDLEAQVADRPQRFKEPLSWPRAALQARLDRRI